MAFAWEDIEPLLNRVVNQNGFFCPALDYLAMEIENTTKKIISMMFGAIEELRRTKQAVFMK